MTKIKKQKRKVKQDNAPRQEKPVYVSMEIDGKTHPVGCIKSTSTSHKYEENTFQYEQSWIDNPLAFNIDPRLEFHSALQEITKSPTIPHGLRDSEPNKWGKRVLTYQYGAKKRFLFMGYPLAALDDMRQGALRFSHDPPHDKQVTYLRSATEPETYKTLSMEEKLNRLQKEAEAIENGSDDHTENPEMPGMFYYGLTMGGARPKACIRLDNGNYAMVKFQSIQDTPNYNIWEGIENRLAEKAGLRIPNFWIKNLDDNKVAVITERFDRKLVNGKLYRIPYISAETMIQALKANKGEKKLKQRRGKTYSELNEAIRKYVPDYEESLQLLFESIVFAALTSNTDNHMRNYGFLWNFAKRQWELSPQFDMVPTWYSQESPRFATNLKPNVFGLPITKVIEDAEMYCLTKDKAIEITTRMAKAVVSWEDMAREYPSIKDAQIKDAVIAFRQAREFLKGE